MRFRTALAATCLLALGVLPAAADIVNLQASQDNTLYFSPTGDLSNAKGQFLFTGKTALDETRRALVKFDIAGAIPTGSTINSATLRLYYDIAKVTGPGNIATNGSRSHTVKRVLADWGEATSVAGGEQGGGGTATTGDATWIHRNYTSTSWSAAGGQFNAVASATTTVGIGAGLYSWTSTQLKNDVQSMLTTPASNFGWIVQGVETTSSTAKRFGSREHPTLARRPVLVVDYTPKAPGMPPWGAMVLATLMLAAAMPLLIRRQSVIG